MPPITTFPTPPEPGNVYHTDALALLAAMPDASVNLIATDPPYNGVKDDAWDNQWNTDKDFLDWLRVHLVEYKRVLKPNGSLYLFASPQMAARVEVLTGEYFNVLNQIVWNKPNGNANWRADKEVIRGFLPNTERIIFAEQFKASNSWENAADGVRGSVFEPIRAYLAGEFNRAGVKFEKANEFCGTASMAARHYFARSQWCMPTKEHYESLQRGLNAFGGDYLRREYEDLRREYEDLRREYEDLRRPFNSTPYAPYTDVWTFRTVQTYDGKHPTEKPLELMRHIVKMSSRPGDLVLDTFAGSGTTLDAARQEGRRWLGCDITSEYVDIARRRLAAPYTLPMFERPAPLTPQTGTCAGGGFVVGL